MTHRHSLPLCPVAWAVGSSTTFFFLLRGLSPRANHTDRATAACLRSDCQLVRIEGLEYHYRYECLCLRTVLCVRSGLATG
jgi:hypothetical protein